MLPQEGELTHMKAVSIIGATGYVGLELTRLLAQHPGVQLSHLVSQSYTGKKFSDVYPSLRGICDKECSEMNLDKIADESDIVITALPHGISKDVIPVLFDKGIRVIDHSGDFRFRDTANYEFWYQTHHGMPALNQHAVYGLPEMYRTELCGARLVGNPGCYPTCSVLALAPLVHAKAIDCHSIIINASSGYTGAGRKADTAYSFCESDSNYKAYGVGFHRHTGEIEQEISFLAGEGITLSFTPHLMPVKRGMLATIHAKLSGSYETQELLRICQEYYKDEYFIRVLPEGCLPEIKNVTGSNFLDMGLIADKRTQSVTVLSAIDNLMKGAAGQAVQVLNLMTGQDEKTGLTAPALYL